MFDSYKMKKLITLCLLVMAGFQVAFANDVDTTFRQTVISVATVTNADYRETGFVRQDRPLRFVWGAELEGGVDMSGHDMSSLGINASFGFEWQWIRFFGVGAQADVMVSNSSTAYPLYVNFRTDFSRRRRLIFVDMRGGVAVANLDHERRETIPYVSGGIGVTLAAGRKFNSHLIIGYTWLGQKQCYKGDILRDCPGISYAQMRLGVSF